jgi:hypothetical protein
LIHQFSVSLQIVPFVVTLFGSLSCSLVRKGEVIGFLADFFTLDHVERLAKFLQF